MRRTTVFVEDAVLDALRAIARRRRIPLAEVTRKALSAYISKHRDTLSIIGIGRSGRRDIAERAEELLREGFGR